MVWKTGVLGVLFQSTTALHCSFEQSGLELQQVKENHTLIVYIYT